MKRKINRLLLFCSICTYILLPVGENASAETIAHPAEITSFPTELPTPAGVSAPTGTPDVSVPAGTSTTDTPAPTYSPAFDIGEYKSNLPVMYINTENSQPVTSKEVYLPGTLYLYGNGSFTGSGTLYKSGVQIKGRGNMTWDCSPKKPYHIKLDNSADLLGLGRGKHWVLLANYYDESLLRNKLSSELARSLGLEAMDSTWVELVLNGDYIGNYQLYEQIRIGTDRVNITDWTQYAKDFAKAVYQAHKKEGFDKKMRDDMEDYLTQNMAWTSTGKTVYRGISYAASDYGIELPECTGGFLLEMDSYYNGTSKFRTERGYAVSVKRPEYLATGSRIMDYATSYFQAFEDCVFGEEYACVRDGERYHYSQLVDMDSIVSFWLVTEIFFNFDSGWKSTYLYKDVDTIMKFGPVWDFDLSAGSPFYTSYSHATWWSRYSQSCYFNRLISDPYFLTKVREAYWKEHGHIESMLGEDGSIAQYQDYLHASGMNNSSLWYWFQGYEADSQAFSTWMRERISWLDRQMASQDALPQSLCSYYASDALTISLKNEQGVEYAADTGRQNVTGDYNVTSPGVINLEVAVNDSRVAQVDITVNGMLCASGDAGNGLYTTEISRSTLTEERDRLNVLIVYAKNDNGDILSSNFITIYDGNEKEIKYETAHDGKILSKTSVSPAEETPAPSPAPIHPLAEPSPSIPGKDMGAVPSTPPQTGGNTTQTARPAASSGAALKKGKIIKKGGLVFCIKSFSAKKGGTLKITGVTNKNLKRVIIPKEVKINGLRFKITSIDKEAFTSCRKLKSISIKTTKLKSLQKLTFKKGKKKITVFVPKKKAGAYRKLFRKNSPVAIKYL